MSNATTSATGSVLTEKVALISINVSIFSGYRRATAEIIQRLGGQLPDSDAITEGSVKVFPGEKLAPLATIRRGLFRKLASRGVRALGSKNVFAVNREDLAEIEDEIEESREEFESERQAVDADYDQNFEDYATKHKPAEAAIIRSLKIERADAMAGIRFATSVFQIAPLMREGEDQEKGVSEIVQGLSRQLYQEVADDMREILTKNEAFTTHLRVGQKTLRPIRAAMDKLRKLAFLDASIDGAIRFIGDTLAALPSSGYIEDSPQGANGFTALRRLMEELSDVDRFINAAGRVANGVSAVDVLFPPAPVAAPPVPPAAAVVAQPAPVSAVVAGSGAPSSLGQTQLPRPPMPPLPNGFAQGKGAPQSRRVPVLF